MATSKHTIVYAEDDLDDLFMVQEAFKKHGQIELVHASNGSKALDILRSMRRSGFLPCLVILDINMPIMDGKEALEKIRGEEGLRKVPVLLFSTSNSPAETDFAAKYNVELVTKPLHFADLESIAQHFVERCNFSINKLNQLK